MPEEATAARSNDKLAAALALADYGFCVFPLIPNDKRPLIENWQNLATNDKACVKSWWLQNPDANIGITTHDLLVIDVDPRNGGDKTFRDVFETGHMIGEDFPPTLAAATQGGGTHMFYWLQPGTTARGGANKLGPGVDIKAHGGYVVGAGSTIDGRAYSWKPNYAPDKIEFAQAPEWLVVRCNTKRQKSADAGKVIVLEDELAIRACRTWMQQSAPQASIGERGYTAFKVACRFYDYGVSKETCVELLEEWSEEYCEAPMDGSDIEHAAYSALKNRENSVGAKHPDAPGFDEVEIAPREMTSVSPTSSDDPLQPKGEQQQSRRGIYKLSYDEANDLALDRTGEPLIEGLLDRGAMSVWYGESNSGKTFVMLDAAWHVAAGRPWASMPTKHGAVVYVAAEGGQGILKRVRALRQQYPDASDVKLFIVPCPVNLLKPDADLRPLAAEIRSAGDVELVVIDTLSRAMAGGNENSPDDMGAFVSNLDLLRRATGAHVAIVHHTGKDKAKGARGHSLLRAATDTEVEIDNSTLTVTKQRDMDGDMSFRFALKPHNLGVSKTGVTVTSCTVEIRGPGDDDLEPVELAPHMAEFVETIRQALRDRGANSGAHPGAHPNRFGMDLLEGIGFRHSGGKLFSRTTLQERLTELTEKGWLKKTKRGQWDMFIAGNAGFAET